MARKGLETLSSIVDSVASLSEDFHRITPADDQAEVEL